MRTLVLGATGMLGHKVLQVFASRFETWGTTRSPSRNLGNWHPLDGDRIIPRVDALQFDSVAGAIAQVKPHAVINCIGLIKHQKPASNPILALKVNSLFPHRLSVLCQATGARLVNIATDCAFSGRKGMYRETDIPDPVDLYGRTKLLGEVTGAGCLTLRTSIIGREINTRHGLVEWFLSNSGGTVRGFYRAIFSGFPTQVLARVIADVLEKHPALEGLYHVSAEPINKYDLLVLLNEALDQRTDIQRDDEFVCDRSLDSTRFREVTGFQPASWPEMVQELADDCTPYDTWKRRLD